MTKGFLLRSEVLNSTNYFVSATAAVSASVVVDGEGFVFAACLLQGEDFGKSWPGLHTVTKCAAGALKNTPLHNAIWEDIAFLNGVTGSRLLLKSHCHCHTRGEHACPLGSRVSMHIRYASCQVLQSASFHLSRSSQPGHVGYSVSHCLSDIPCAGCTSAANGCCSGQASCNGSSEGLDIFADQSSPLFVRALRKTVSSRDQFAQLPGGESRGGRCRRRPPFRCCHLLRP